MQCIKRGTVGDRPSLRIRSYRVLEMGLEEKHNVPSWTPLPEAAKVCKELVKCGCKEKHVGGHANACLFHFHAQNQ